MTSEQDKPPEKQSAWITVISIIIGVLLFLWIISLLTKKSKTPKSNADRDYDSGHWHDDD
jgi:hypothetical protein